MTGAPLEECRLVDGVVSGARLVEKESSTEVTAVLSLRLSSGLVMDVIKSRLLDELNILAMLSWDEWYMGH